MHTSALCMYERPSPGFCALCLCSDAFPPLFDAQLIQYAKSQGIKTINVVRRSSQFDELKALGCASQSFLEFPRLIAKINPPSSQELKALGRLASL